MTRFRRRGRAGKGGETVLVLGLAVLVLIQGGLAVGGVVGAFGQMVAAVLDALG